MSDEHEAQVITGDGYAVASLDGIGAGPGFRKVAASRWG